MVNAGLAVELHRFLDPVPVLGSSRIVASPLRAQFVKKGFVALGGRFMMFV